MKFRKLYYKSCLFFTLSIIFLQDKSLILAPQLTRCVMWRSAQPRKIFLLSHVARRNLQQFEKEHHNCGMLCMLYGVECPPPPSSCRLALAFD